MANASVYSSVMGTPSTTYWICPCEPRTWMRPFWLGMKPAADSSIAESCFPGVALGSWSRSTRQVDASASQGVAHATSSGGSEGALVEVVDAVWSGAVECRVATVGMAFLQVGRVVYWVKSAPAAFGQPLTVSLSGHGHFGGGWGESSLPLVPVSVGGARAESCRMGAVATTTGVPHVLCEVDGAILFIVLMQGALARTGRCRNWHLRLQAAALLPGELETLFTQRRAGVWREPSGKAASDVA